MSDHDNSGLDAAVEQPSSSDEAPDADIIDDLDSEKSDGPTGLPDPGFLLNMAAVQMDSASLMRALIPIFDQYAWSSMGFVADPKTGETQTDLPSAKLAIDAVQFLLSRVEPQLEESIKRDMQRRLSDLRINYVNKLNA